MKSSWRSKLCWKVWRNIKKTTQRFVVFTVVIVGLLYCILHHSRQAWKWAKPEVNWRACAFTTSGVTGHRTYSFFVRCVTYIPNLRKIGQKLWLLSWTIGISDRQTSDFYPNVTTLRSGLCYRNSVCRLSVTLVHPTQVVEAFGKISSPLCTLAILWPPCKLLRR